MKNIEQIISRVFDLKDEKMGMGYEFSGPRVPSAGG